MSNIKLTADDRKSGKTIYTSAIMQNIVEIAVAEVEGAVLTEGKKGGVSLYIERDGVYVNVSVAAKYGYNVPELAYRIQQSVKQSVENMTNYKVAEVDVHVADIVFCDQPAAEPEKDEEDREENEN